VQLNLAFREPLSSSQPNAAELEPVSVVLEQQPKELQFAVLDGATPTVVIAGAEAGPDAVELAEAFGWPLLAEPSSGARWGANAVLGYRLIFDSNPELINQIGRVVVFGKPTLSRAVIRLLFDESVDVVVVKSERMGHFDVSRRASLFVDEITVDSEVDFAWLKSWLLADQTLRLAAPVSANLSRREIVECVWDATEGAQNLMLGASRMIREAETWAPAKPINVFSNRGLAGIDGTIATANGVALASGQKTRVLLGDLTFLHDVGSLAIDPVDSPQDLQLVVVNDHGGSIFESLEMAKELPASQFDRMFRTPQQVNLAALALAYGWRHEFVQNEDELREALERDGRVVIEIEL
jgi:2-succinyl-5-enolpyruvyl-6-hydroxy-3-cyclohexene-1-carboxylate synthase